MCKAIATKNALIVGSTGMIGNHILEVCKNRVDIKKLVCLNRRKTIEPEDKIEEIVHKDFYDFSDLRGRFTDIDYCFFCVGVYTGQVSTNDFKRITVDLTVAFGLFLKEECPKAVFCFLSGKGADPSEKSRILFAREKGKAENILKELAFRRLHIFRPGYIFPVKKRKEPNRLYGLLRIIYPYISWLSRDLGVNSDQLAQVMVDVAFEKEGLNIYENRDIKMYNNY